MENLISLITTVDLFAWLGAITALIGAVIAIAQLIPGDEPEATLQKIVDLLARFSRK
jgi:hypothetical protein